MVTGESTGVGVAKVYSTPSCTVPDELLVVGPLYQLRAGCSVLSVYTQPQGGHLCHWATKDSPEYPMTHGIPSFHWEIPCPGVGTQHSCLDFEGL